MLKRILCGVLSMTLTLSLAACGQAPAESKQPENGGEAKEPAATGETTEVSMYTWWGDSEQDLGEAIVKDFEKEHPEIDVKENYIPYNDYLSKINTLIAAKQTPDVFLIQEFLANEWGTKGVAKDLRPLYEAQGLTPEDLYLPTAMYRTDNSLWGVNPSLTTICLFYNKTLFEAANITPPGLDATNPWTWEEYVDAAVKLTKDASGKTPKDAGFDINNAQVFGTLMPNNQNNLQALMYAAGTSIASEDGMSLEITKEKGVDALQKIADLSLKEQCAPSVAATKSAFSNAAVMLMNDQLGMFIDGAYVFPNFTNEGYEVGVTAIPKIGEKANNMAWGATLMIGADTKVENEAFTFLQFITNFDKTVEASINNKIGMGNLPHTLSTMNDPDLYKKWEENYDPAMTELTTSILKDASRVGECVTLKNFATIVEQTLLPQLDKVWLGEMTAQEAMSTMDETLTPEMEGVWQ